MLASYCLSCLAPNNSTGGNHEFPFFSRHCFPTYFVITKPFNCADIPKQRESKAHLTGLALKLDCFRLFEETREAILLHSSTFCFDRFRHSRSTQEPTAFLDEVAGNGRSQSEHVVFVGLPISPIFSFRPGCLAIHFQPPPSECCLLRFTDLDEVSHEFLLPRRLEELLCIVICAGTRAGDLFPFWAGPLQS